MARRKRRESRTSRRQFNPAALIGFFLILFVSGALGFGAYRMRNSSFFEIKTVEADIEVSEWLQREIKGKSLFEIDVEKVYRKIHYRYPELKKIYIKKIFPSTLKIETVKRRPFAQLKENGFYLLDEEFVALKKTERAPFGGVMTIELDGYPRSIRKGALLNDKRLVLSYSLVRALNKSRLSDIFEIKHINASREDSISFLMDDVNIIVGKGDFSRKLYLLENLLRSKFQNDITSLRYIDLRFASSSDNIYIGNKR